MGFGCDVIFKLDTTGKETVLYRFTGATDGRSPISGLVTTKLGDGAFALYGSTTLGGELGCLMETGLVAESSSI